jgi:hypothetical protein
VVDLACLVHICELLDRRAGRFSRLPAKHIEVGAVVQAHKTNVEQTRELRADSCLERARGEPPPERARARINAISTAAPIRITLSADGHVLQQPDVPAGYPSFEAAIARSASSPTSARTSSRFAGRRAAGCSSCANIHARSGAPRRAATGPRVARHAASPASRKRDVNGVPASDRLSVVDEGDLSSLLEPVIWLTADMRVERSKPAERLPR